MSTPGQSPEQIGQPYNPQTVIAEANLDYQTLKTLQEGLEGPWENAIRNERLERERLLENTRTCRPARTESPPYDNQDPDAYHKYIEQARAVKLSPHEESRGMQREAKAIRERATQYVDQPAMRDTLQGVLQVVGPGALATSFTRNLFGVVSTAYSVPLRQFEIQRNTIMRKHFPALHLESREQFEYSGNALPTRAQIDAARQEINAIPPMQTPYPNFFALSAAQQNQIMRNLGVEWLDLCLFLRSYDLNALSREGFRTQAPLAYHSVNTLRQAIRHNPEVTVAQICRAFFNAPEEFHERVAILKRESTTATAARFTAEERRRQDRIATAAAAAALKKSPEQIVMDDFSRYDHALISVGNRQFYLPMDQTYSFLAARVLQALAQPRDVQEVKGPNLVNTIWQAMLPEERSLFTTRQADLARVNGGIINSAVLGVLRHLTNFMGITREKSGEVFKIENQPLVRLALEPPPEEAFALLHSVFPPGTPPEKIHRITQGEVSEEALTRAGTLLHELLETKTVFSHRQALDALDFITDPYGKRALRLQLEAAERDIGLEDTLDLLHRRLSTFMPGAYWETHANRTISGHIATGDRRIQFTSGRLPTRAKQIKLPTNMKWYIGQPRQS